MKKMILTSIFLLITLVGYAFTTHVTITTYNPVKEQCDATPLITADGTKINLKHLKSGKQRIVAISRDLLWCIPLGSIIEIDGFGRYEVRDLMHARYNHCIDILQHSSKKNTKQEKVAVKVIKKGKK